MIKIMWGGEELILEKNEAEGFVESLESEGEVFSWVDLDPTPAAPVAPTAWVGDARPRFEGADAGISRALKASSDEPLRERTRAFLPCEANIRAAIAAKKRSPRGGPTAPLAGIGPDGKAWVIYMGQRSDFAMSDLPQDLAKDLADLFNL